MWKSHKKPQTTTTTTQKPTNKHFPGKIKQNCSISWRHSPCQFTYWDFKKVGNAQVNGTLNVMQLEFLLIILNDQNDLTSKGSDPICQLFSERKLRGNERTRRIPRVTIIHTETTVDCGLFLLNCLTRDSFHLQRRRKKKKESPWKPKKTFQLSCVAVMNYTADTHARAHRMDVVIPPFMKERKHADTEHEMLDSVKWNFQMTKKANLHNDR